MPFLIFILTGLGAGILSGLFGVGGGIVIVPALVLGLGFSQTTAAGTSLVSLLLPVGIGGVVAYYQAGKIDLSHIRAGLWIALGISVGSYVGSKFAMMMSEQTLKRLFAVFLLIVSVRTWLGAR